MLPTPSSTASSPPDVHVLSLRVQLSQRVMGRSHVRVRYHPYYGLANPEREKETSHLSRNLMRRAHGLCRVSRAAIMAEAQASAAHINEVEEYLVLLRIQRDMLQCREADCPASKAERRAKIRVKVQAADAWIHEVEEHLELLRTKHEELQRREAHADEQLGQVRDALDQNGITEFSQSDDEGDGEGFDLAYHDYKDPSADGSSEDYYSSEYDSEECSTISQTSTGALAVDANLEP